ncbi:hypothetical protein ABZ738_30115 [Micromonospora sp. NPDC047793]|uniref:hypothetical protein n=1 Tax=unclassified Micromonospora TaxID=2617518 RepID=UPI0033D80891
MVYDDDPSDPPHHEFSSKDRPLPAPECPRTPELYDLIAGVVKDLPGEPLARLCSEAQRRQRVRQFQLEYGITKGMVLYVQRSLHPEL